MLGFCIPEAHTVALSCMITHLVYGYRAETGFPFYSYSILTLNHISPHTVLDPMALDQSFFPNYELCPSIPASVPLLAVLFFFFF